jgi:hypothetical protein
MGHRCGYVGVPKGHEWFGAGYDDVRRSDGGYVYVHGGLTYGGSGGRGYPSSVSDPDVFWFGFDCAHLGDAPDMDWLEEHNPTLYKIKTKFPREGIVRSLGYCIKECEFLAAQLQSGFNPRPALE